ncbi:hypothetical protein [Dyadobacter pollutisoli]|uniref:PNPLA domain-containing protein n=1 Tax=Dyadobacter pollutisoli TaxID=2910158 RepID=A0A9E8N583_9BACT|nr:hypothetical protein [Dyadobacter pollutisoli]WAC10010.1 hypothetical protein ON006_19885 [Dyadobacter pollutisoli]
MRNLYIDVRIGNVIAVLKPLFWLLLIEVLVFTILALIPQGHDVYVYLLEEGFWTNAVPIILLFIALIFLSCSSGLGGEMILSQSETIWLPKLPEDVPENPDQTNAGYGSFRSWLVTFLWYFPYLSFLLGLYKVIAFQKKTDSEGFGNTAIFLTLFFTGLGLWLIFKVRKGIWRYIRYRLEKIHNDDKKASEFIQDFRGAGKVKLKDFKPLINILCVFFTFSVLLFIVFAFLPSNFYYFIGAAALMVFGLGTWTNVYVAVELIDKLYKVNPFSFTFNGRGYSLSLKMVILIWVLICSYFNSDHPVNALDGAPLKPNVTLAENLDRYHRTFKPDGTKIPIVFVAVDGGASRTGLFGAMMLSVLQDNLPDFKNHVFAYSDISGGTLGANVFYALSRDGLVTQDKSDTCFTEQSRRFFKRDFLAPVIGTFLFGDALGYFWPGYIPKFDRGLALETEWQAAWKDIMPFLKNKTENAMELGVKRMLEISDTAKYFKPVMFINSHEVETGKRAIYSNVLMNDTVFSAISNLNNRVNRDLPFSSAILFSARFPLISPSVAVEVDGIKRHYVDGGYFESSGTLTLYEALLSLEDSLKSNMYDVFVIHLDGSEELAKDANKGNRFLNEPLDIITGAISDQSGHTEFATENLKNYVSRRYKKSHFITLKVGDKLKDVPVNWVLSNGAINRVLKRCKDIWATPDLDELKQAIGFSLPINKQSQRLRR